MIGRCRGAEELGEDRLQGVGPHLIALEGRVQLVGVHHAVEELAVLVRELVVDVEEADAGAVGELARDSR